MPRTVLLIASVLAASGCQHAALKKEIADLDAEIDARRTQLGNVAAAYRAVPGAGMQVDLSGKPMVDVFKAIDAKSDLERIITIQSTERHGRIAETWTKCWPFNSRAGIYLRLWRDDSLVGAFYLGKTHPKWGSNGLEFDFDLNGTAVAIIAVGAEYCIGSSDLSIFPVPAATGFQRTKARLRLTPVGNSLQYRIILDHPPYYVIGTCVFGFCAGWPFRMDEELSKGEISNVIGSRGRIALAETGELREFELKIELTDVAFLEGGLRASGPVGVKWSTPDPPPD